MPSISKLITLIAASACAANAAAITRRDETTTSSVIKILEADPNVPSLPDMSINLVQPNLSDVRGDVPDYTDMATDIAPGNNDKLRIAAVTTEDITTTDTLLFSVSIGEFLAAKAAGQPSTLNWSDDGCSSSPDQPFGFDFLRCCKRHDFGYRNYKAQGRFTEANRESIDINFKNDLYDLCAEEGFWRGVCETTADIYFEAVRAFGNL